MPVSGRRFARSCGKSWASLPAAPWSRVFAKGALMRPDTLMGQEIQSFAVVAASSASTEIREDCGEKRTNWDHDLAQLEQ
jgi:hypothetical protein